MLDNREDYRFVSQEAIKHISIEGEVYPRREQKLVEVGEDMAFLEESTKTIDLKKGNTPSVTDNEIWRVTKENYKYKGATSFRDWRLGNMVVETRKKINSFFMLFSYWKINGVWLNPQNVELEENVVPPIIYEYKDKSGYYQRGKKERVYFEDEGYPEDFNAKYDTYIQSKSTISKDLDDFLAAKEEAYYVIVEEMEQRHIEQIGKIENEYSVALQELKQTYEEEKQQIKTDYYEVFAEKSNLMVQLEDEYINSHTYFEKDEVGKKIENLKGEMAQDEEDFINLNDEKDLEYISAKNKAATDYSVLLSTTKKEQATEKEEEEKKYKDAIEEKQKEANDAIEKLNNEWYDYEAECYLSRTTNPSDEYPHGFISEYVEGLYHNEPIRNAIAEFQKQFITQSCTDLYLQRELLPSSSSTLMEALYADLEKMYYAVISGSYKCYVNPYIDTHNGWGRSCIPIEITRGKKFHTGSLQDDIPYDTEVGVLFGNRIMYENYKNKKGIYPEAMYILVAIFKAASRDEKKIQTERAWWIDERWKLWDELTDEEKTKAEKGGWYDYVDDFAEEPTITIVKKEKSYKIFELKYLKTPFSDTLDRFDAANDTHDKNIKQLYDEQAEEIKTLDDEHNKALQTIEADYIAKCDSVDEQCDLELLEANKKRVEDIFSKSGKINKRIYDALIGVTNEIPADIKKDFSDEVITPANSEFNATEVDIMFRRANLKSICETEKRQAQEEENTKYRAAKKTIEEKYAARIEQENERWGEEIGDIKEAHDNIKKNADKKKQDAYDAAREAYQGKIDAIEETFGVSIASISIAYGGKTYNFEYSADGGGWYLGGYNLGDEWGGEWNGWTEIQVPSRVFVPKTILPEIEEELAPAYEAINIKNENDKQAQAERANAEAQADEEYYETTKDFLPFDYIENSRLQWGTKDLWEKLVSDTIPNCTEEQSSEQDYYIYDLIVKYNNEHLHTGGDFSKYYEALEKLKEEKEEENTTPAEG